MRNDFQIIVIGGGIVGACVAALAAADRRLAGLRIAVLEAQPPAGPPPSARGDVDLRVSAVSRASERILSALGAWALIPEQHLSAYDEMVVWDAASRPHAMGSLHFAAAAAGEPNLGHIVENRRLRWALHDCGSFRDRVTLLRAQLAGLEFEAERALVILDDGRRIGADLVVGCDGASSSSRKLAGIDTSGWSYAQHAFVTHVRTAEPHGRTAWQRFLRDGPIAFLPLADGRSSIVWTTRPDHAQELMRDAPEQVAAQIEAAIDGVLGAVELAGPRGQFPLSLVHAREYCRERFVLVGDAAHAVHPLAGQGVNLGLLDAAALIEVLGTELAGAGAGEAATLIGERRVLRRYERWRKSENTIALGLIDGLNRLFGASSPWLGSARRLGLTLVDHSAYAKRLLMGRALGVSGGAPRIAGRHSH